MTLIQNIIIASWQVLGQMAPYLLFGFLAAGILSVLVSAEWVEQHLGGRGLMPVIKSAILGVPLPLCSCSVIPVTASIHHHGAGKGASTSFLLSTPQTGVDSIFATYALLGPVFAVIRPLVALLTGVIGGGIVSLLEPKTPTKTQTANKPDAAHCTDACCASTDSSRLRRMLHYGFVMLPGDIAGALTVGIVVAGAMSTLVEKDFLAAYLGGGIIAMLVMMAVGIPIYVCSTASIPIAVGFMHMGASPGAALVFLITGPATNAAAVSVVWNILGRRTAMIYFLTVALGALTAGFLLDFAFSSMPGISPVAAHAHPQEIGWAGHVMAIVLLVLLGVSLVKKKFPKSTLPAPLPQAETRTTGRIVLKVTGMTCSHCAGTVSRTLREIAGVNTAKVDLKNSLAFASGENLDTQALIEAIQSLGYEASLDSE